MNDRFHYEYSSINNDTVEIKGKSWGVYFYVVNNRAGGHPNVLVEAGIVTLWSANVYTQTAFYRRNGCSCAFAGVSSVNYTCTVTHGSEVSTYFTVSLLYLNGAG